MRAILYFFLFICIFSCTSNTVYEKPQDLIPKDTMVMLLQDMYVANASKYFENKDKQKYKPYIHLVYNTYKIDSLRFTNSNIYYTSRIDEYEELLLQVKTNLDSLLEEKSRIVAKDKKLDTLNILKKIDFVENIKIAFDSLKGNFLKEKFPFKKLNSIKKPEYIELEENIKLELDSLVSKDLKEKKSFKKPKK